MGEQLSLRISPSDKDLLKMDLGHESMIINMFSIVNYRKHINGKQAR